MQVTTYRRIAQNGRHISMATKVILDDGKEIKFMSRLSKREAIRQVGIQTYHQHMAIARSMGLDALRQFHATWTGPRP